MHSREAKTINTIDMADNIRGIILILGMMRNTLRHPTQWIFPLNPERPFFKWLTTTDHRNPLQKQLDTLGFPPELIPQAFRSTRGSQSIMSDPVTLTTSDEIYERSELESWISDNLCDPANGQPASLDIIKPLPELKQAINTFAQEITQKINEIRYRSIATRFFCSPRPLSDQQYQAIATQVLEQHGMLRDPGAFPANPL